MGSRARLLLLAATALAAILLFLVLRPGGEEPAGTVSSSSGETTIPSQADTETETQTETDVTTSAQTPDAIRIRIQARGDGSGSIRRVAIKQGQRVTLIVSADVSDEVHVHGYDLMADVAPGSPARISFEASVPGRFEVELESRALQIAELSVTP